MKQELSNNEINQLVHLLHKLEPGFLPFEMFLEIARLTVLPIIEMVPLRLNAGGEAEVLLLHRSKDDIIWPDKVHIPGTVIRADDQENNTFQPFKRIIDDELAGTKVSKPYFSGTILHKSLRGMEYAQVYWVEVQEDPKIGKFYPAYNLPANLIESQRDFIQSAADSFKSASQK